MQQRDYFLDPPRAGTFAHVDVFTAGVQGAIEKRIPIEDATTGMLHLRGSAMGSLGFGDVAAHADVRFLGLITLGASAGYRRVWNAYSYPDNVANTRERRHDKVNTATEPRGPKGVSWPWLEVRGRLVIPLESLWLIANAALRIEDPGGDAMPDNSFDWFHTNVHDAGRLARVDGTLFYRHGRFGAIGPTVRYLDVPRNGGRAGEIAYGLTFGTRPGFFRRDDLLLVQTLVDLRDQDRTFGWHVGPLARIPLYAMLIYRKSFEF